MRRVNRKPEAPNGLSEGQVVACTLAGTILLMMLVFGMMEGDSTGRCAYDTLIKATPAYALGCELTRHRWGN